jgi:hypothetical protein
MFSPARLIARFDDIQKLVELGFPLSHHEANRKGIGLSFKHSKKNLDI